MPVSLSDNIHFVRTNIALLAWRQAAAAAAAVVVGASPPEDERKRHSSARRSRQAPIGRWILTEARVQVSLVVVVPQALQESAPKIAGAPRGVDRTIIVNVIQMILIPRW